MKSYLTAMGIDQWHLRAALPGAKQVISLCAYSLVGTESLIFVEGGLVSPDAQSLFANMMAACQFQITLCDDCLASRDMKHSSGLLFCHGGGDQPSPAIDLLSPQIENLTLCSHPEDLLQGQSKANAWLALQSFRNSIAV